MSRYNLIKTVMGDARAEHAAMIMMNQHNWEAYEAMHHNVFAEHNLKKYHVINAEGKVIDKLDDKLALVHNTAGTLRANAGTVRHEDFLVIRDKIIEVRRRDLAGIADLKAAGLTFSVGIGDQLVGFETVNEFQEAKQEMNPQNYDNNDTVFTEEFVPNPITHSTFSIPWRQEGFNYKRSLGMTESLRQINERLDDTLFNGNTDIVVRFSSTNFPIHGYTTDPDRGTGTISDWTNAANNDVIVTELIRELGTMHNTQGGVQNNSVMVYVHNDIWTNLQKDYDSTHPSKTTLARIMDIAQVKDVKPAEKLTTSTDVVLVEMLARTVELAIASDIIVVPHIKTTPLLPQVLTGYAAMVHKIKSDSAGNTGVRHLSI